MTLELLDEKEKTLRGCEVQAEIQSASNWTWIAFALDVPSKYAKLSQAKYLMVSMRGKDNHFWSGHYGTKFSRVSVDVRLKK